MVATHSARLAAGSRALFRTRLLPLRTAPIFWRSILHESMSSNFLTAEWKKLAMANYAVDPSLVSEYLPAGTEVDLWNDTCYVSLVGFMFCNTRLMGIKVPFHVNFEEVNLRFYVKRRHEGEWRRGVVFIKEIVPRPALALVANTLYNERYETMPMQHTWAVSGHGQTVEYRWKKGAWHSLKLVADSSPVPMQPGSEEEFIAEHYWGYTQVSKSRTSEYQVEHPKWQVYPVQKCEVEVDFGKVYGDEFSILNQQQPQSVLLAEGSAIAVKKGQSLRLS